MKTKRWANSLTLAQWLRLRKTHKYTHRNPQRIPSSLLPGASFQRHWNLFFLHCFKTSDVIVLRRAIQGCTRWALLNHPRMEARQGEAMKSLMKFLASNIHGFNHPNQHQECISHSLLPQFISCIVGGIQTSDIMVPNSLTGTSYHKWVVLNIK